MQLLSDSTRFACCLHLPSGACNTSSPHQPVASPASYSPSSPRYLAHTYVAYDGLQLVALTCLWIASKYEEVRPPGCRHFAQLTNNVVSSLGRGEGDGVLRREGLLAAVPGVWDHLQCVSKICMSWKRALVPCLWGCLLHVKLPLGCPKTQLGAPVCMVSPRILLGRLNTGLQ